MKAFILSLFLTTSCLAETVIIPVQDFLLTHQNFLPPKFNFNSALNGTIDISNSPKLNRKQKKELEKELIYLIEELYPDVENIKIWNGNIIFKVEGEKRID